MTSSSTVLDRSRTTLVVVDIQERLAAAMEWRERVIAQTALLVRAAAITGVPIVVTRQYPKGLGPTEPALVAILDEASGTVPVNEVDKLTFDCFSEPGFSAVIEATGRRQLLLAGMETHICITQTALAGVRAGYDVHVAADACCSREDAIHDLALARMAHAGAAVSCAESAAYELVGRAGTDEFKALLGVVKG